MRDLTLSDRFNQDLCCYCLTETPSHMSDALGVPWCEAHAYRGQFISWGMAHNFPPLAIEPYAVAAGAYAWYIAATQGNDAMLGMLLGLIEMEERIAA